MKTKHNDFNQFYFSNAKTFDFLQRHELTGVDGRTWLHEPSLACVPQRSSTIWNANWRLLLRWTHQFNAVPVYQIFDSTIEYRPVVSIQWIFYLILIFLCGLLLSMLLNFIIFESHTFTGRRYVDESELHVEIWPRSQLNAQCLNLDAAYQQRTFNPPDTWSCPTFGLASVLILRPNSPELVLCPDFWIPRYFCFASWHCHSSARHYDPWVTIKREILTPCHKSMWTSDLSILPSLGYSCRLQPPKYAHRTWYCDRVKVGIMTRVTIRRENMTRSDNSTLTHNPVSQPIANFPWLSGDVPRLLSCGVYISQLVRFARCCTNVLDFHTKIFKSLPNYWHRVTNVTRFDRHL